MRLFWCKSSLNTLYTSSQHLFSIVFLKRLRYLFFKNCKRVLVFLLSILDHRVIGKASCFSDVISLAICFCQEKKGLYLPGNMGQKQTAAEFFKKLLKNFVWNSSRKSSLPCLMSKATIYWISKTEKKNVKMQNNL